MSAKSRQFICSAIIALAVPTAVRATEPLSLRLLRQYHQQNARIRAEAERQRKQFEQWEKDWHRQEQARREILIRRRER